MAAPTKGIQGCYVSRYAHSKALLKFEQRSVTSLNALGILARLRMSSVNRGRNTAASSALPCGVLGHCRAAQVCSRQRALHGNAQSLCRAPDLCRALCWSVAVQVSLPCGIFCHCRDSCLCRALVSIFAVARIFVVRFSPSSRTRLAARQPLFFP
jgi:hypothetical protein